VVRHTPDAENPADFLTKWVPHDKFAKSIEYLTNSGNAVDATDPAMITEATGALKAAIARALQIRAAVARTSAGGPTAHAMHLASM
jgi:hypothetical protein